MQRFTTIFTFLLLFFTMGGKILYSQKHPQLQTIGIKIGAGLYGIAGDGFYDEYDKNLSLHFLPLVNFSLADDIHICSALGFEMKGAPDGRFNYNTRLSYLVFPVYGKYLFNKNPRFYFLAGIYGGYLLSAKEKGEMKIGPEVTRLDRNVIEDFKPIDLGITAGAGYMIRLGFDVDFFVELKTNIGLLNISEIEGRKSRNYGYSLSVGYLYYIGFR